MTPSTWKTALSDRMNPDWSDEIDLFEGQMKLRRQGKLEEKVFAETRLRRGAYGQRYDNGQRSDGVAIRDLPFDERPTKGPDTVWDAPGMQRIKIPFGGVSPEQTRHTQRAEIIAHRIQRDVIAGPRRHRRRPDHH